MLAFWIYRFYILQLLKKGPTKGIAYFSTLTALSMLLFLNVFVIILILGLDANKTLFFFFIEEHGTVVKLLSSIFSILPYYLLFHLLLKKRKNSK